MQAARDQEQPDEDVTAQAAMGNIPAFPTLYERYFDDIYDIAVRTAGRADTAAEVVQKTFTKARESMQKGRSGSNVKAWLYTIARNSAIDEMRYGKRLGSGDEPTEGGGGPPLFAQPDPSRSSSAEAVLEDNEMTELVWSSAAALSPKQYSLLDMHLRRGLSAEELAESLHLTRGNIYTMLTRLRDVLVESVTYVLLMRRGRAECRELDMLLTETQIIEYTRETRRVLQNHLKICQRCQANKRRFVSPLEVFAGLALVPAAPGVKAAIWQNISARISGVPVWRDRLLRGRTGPLPVSRGPLRIAVVVGGALALIVALVAGMLVFASGGGSGGAAISDPSDVHSTDREPGEQSSDNRIEMEWTAVPDAQAYSILWSPERRDLPDTEGDLPGSATGTTSPPLDPDSWYFHLRTQDNDGRWTSTVHVGPFEVIAATETPRPTRSPSPSPTQRETPVPTPNFGTPTPGLETPSPSPAPTPAPTAAPTPAPTPAPTTAATPSPIPTQSSAPKPTPTP